MTLLTREQVEKLAAQWAPWNGATHWDGCETAHKECAIQKLAGAYLAAASERDALRDAVSEAVRDLRSPEFSKDPYGTAEDVEVTLLRAESPSPNVPEDGT